MPAESMETHNAASLAAGRATRLNIFYHHQILLRTDLLKFIQDHRKDPSNMLILNERDNRGWQGEDQNAGQRQLANATAG
jgi:hypothetical protein